MLGEDETIVVGVLLGTEDPRRLGLVDGNVVKLGTELGTLEGVTDKLGTLDGWKLGDFDGCDEGLSEKSFDGAVEGAPTVTKT